LGLAAPGTAGGPTELGQCPPPRPEQEDNLRSGAPMQRVAVIDRSIKRSVRLTTDADRARGTDTITAAIEMDAVGNETKALFTLRFDPNVLSIDAASFPSPNPDIMPASGTPAGTAIAVNADGAA